MSNKDLYVELLRNGAPELPKNYHYKFWVAPYESKYQTIKTAEQKDWSQALHCAIRKTYWGGLFWKTITTRYLSRHSLIYAGSDDSFTLVNRGWMKEDDFDRKWHLPHMALLAEDTDGARKRIEAQAAVRVEKKKNPAPKADYHIAHYLNKRLP